VNRRLYGIPIPFTREPEPPPRPSEPVRPGPRNQYPQGEPLLRRPAGAPNANASRGAGAGAGVSPATSSRWGIVDRFVPGKVPSMEEFRRLESELSALRNDLATLERDTQNDEATKIHREALHAALIKMDRKINGREL
jgi:hypothetical protein